MSIEKIEYGIKAYGEDIFRFCCYLTGNKNLAEDLYQDTFVKALEISKEVESDKLKAFLFGVAANLWKNQWRKEKRKQEKVFYIKDEDTFVINACNKEEADVLSCVLQNDTEKLVRHIVNSLPKKYKIIVLLHYSGQLTTAEISEQLNLSKGTVTSRLLRARNLIKKRLEENGYER